MPSINRHRKVFLGEAELLEVGKGGLKKNVREAAHGFVLYQIQDFEIYKKNMPISISS